MKGHRYQIIFPILLVLTIALRWEHELFNPKFWSDEMAQYIAAKSIIENHGPSLPVSLSSDFSSTVYLPLKQFPEGYSYLIALIWQITDNLFISAMGWQWIGVCVYLLAWGLLFFHFHSQINPLGVVAFLLITAFSLSPWLYYKPTDLLSISFYWLALVLFSIGMDKSMKMALIYSSLAGFFLFSTITLRYAYQPIVPLTIASIWVLVYFVKSKNRYLSAIALTGTFGTLWWVYHYIIKVKGELPSEAQTKKIYWENLLQADLSIFNKPFFDDRILHTAFNQLGGEGLVHGVKIGSSFLILASVITLIILWVKNSQQAEMKAYIFPFVPAWITALAAVGMLFALSTLSKPQENDYLHVWTYVREVRYYAPLFIISLCTFLFLFFKSNTSQNTWLTLGIWALILINVPYYFIAKYSTIRSDPKYFTLGEEKIMFGESNADVLPILKKVILENTLEEVKPVYFASNRTVRYAQLSGAALPFPNFSGLENAQASKKVALLFHFGKNDPYDSSELKKYISSQPVELIFQSPTDTLYRIILQPKQSKF